MAQHVVVAGATAYGCAGTLSLARGGDARNIKFNMLGRLRVCDPAIDPVNCGGVGN